MSISERISDILQYWRAVEFFTPQNIPKPAPQLSYDPIFEITENDPLFPWEPAHPLQNKRLPNECVLQHLVYCAVYPYSMIKENLEAAFGKDEGTFDEYINGDGCVFAFSVNHEGKPLFDSFILSTCAWALSKMLNKEIKKLDWLDDFEPCAEKLSLDFKTYYKNEDEDLDSKIGKPLVEANIFEVITRLLNKLKLKFDHGITVRVKSKLVRRSNAHKIDDQDFLNSFFIKDLKKISQKAGEKELGSALNEFLANEATASSQQKTDVRENLQYVFDMLKPEHFPSGRWPSAGNYPLVLSQQFSINSIFEIFKNKKEGLFAVNGPPGTGKTTLLRDLIAGVVVDRAKCLAKYSEPTKIFWKTSLGWKSNNYTRVVTTWPKEFANFSIVVASNNNGAVENITLEIPGQNAVDLSCISYTNYFQEFATELLEQPAWALIAARLGNKLNRQNFVQNFWYGPKSIGTENDSSKHTLSFFKLLKEYEKNIDSKSNWQDAVSAFKQALKAEQEIRDKKSKQYIHLKKLSELKKSREDKFDQLKKIIEKLEHLKKEHCLLETIYLSAIGKVDSNKIKRLEHRQFRPKLIDIIFTFGKDYIAWKIADQDLFKAINDALQECVSLKKNLEKLNNEINYNASTLNLLQDEIFKIEVKLNEIIEKDDSIPDFEKWFENGDEKELSSPWADEAWNKARATLFLEALNLHKAFIRANGKVFRQNMQALMDILDGTVPKDAPLAGVKAAWQTLFFVIPVISTTFASFDRLFQHLEKGDIGWLLVDEAGQATPQSVCWWNMALRKSGSSGGPITA